MVTKHMYVTLEVINLARSNGIILFCLPPHTHAIQPLDVAVLKSLKDHFFKAVRALSFTKKDFVVLKCDFALVVKGSFEKAFSMSNIKPRFAKAGIFPFNPNSVEAAKMKPSDIYSPLSSSSSVSGADSSGEPSSATIETSPTLRPERKRRRKHEKGETEEAEPSRRDK